MLYLQNHIMIGEHCILRLCTPNYKIHSKLLLRLWKNGINCMFFTFFCVLRPWLYSRFQSYFNSLDSLLNVSPYDTDHLIFRVDTNNQNDLILSHHFDVISHPSNVTNRGRIVKLWAILLTHHSLDKMAAISQRIYSNAFSWMKSFVFWFKCHWNLFLRANWQ